MTSGTTSKIKLYTFRGKTFECSEWVIRQLNYALALNHSNERYEEVKPSTKKSS